MEIKAPIRLLLCLAFLFYGNVNVSGEDDNYSVDLGSSISIGFSSGQCDSVLSANGPWLKSQSFAMRIDNGKIHYFKTPHVNSMPKTISIGSSSFVESILNGKKLFIDAKASTGETIRSRSIKLTGVAQEWEDKAASCLMDASIETYNIETNENVYRGFPSGGVVTYFIQGYPP